jgi:hypothetical protein
VSCFQQIVSEHSGHRWDRFKPKWDEYTQNTLFDYREKLKERKNQTEKKENVKKERSKRKLKILHY